MRILLTGMNGTVAPVVAERLRASGHETIAWDRSRVSPDDRDASRRFVEDVAPDWLVHAAMGAPTWAETLATASAGCGGRFLYISSASVFSASTVAPIRPDAVPDATDDYGRYKAECERLVLAANPAALVARIGWQIGRSPGKNTMSTYFADASARDGVVRASTRWFPACSFLADTADAFADLMDRRVGGIFHVDGNPGLSIFEIATRLNALQSSPWTVVATDDFVFDNRMADDRVAVAPITSTLGERG